MAGKKPERTHSPYANRIHVQHAETHGSGIVPPSRIGGEHAANRELRAELDRLKAERDELRETASRLLADKRALEKAALEHETASQARVEELTRALTDLIAEIDGPDSDTLGSSYTVRRARSALTPSTGGEK